MLEPIIIGDPDDVHVQAVVIGLEKRGVIPFVVDAAGLEAMPFACEPSSFTLFPDEDPLRLDTNDHRRGWLRRIAPPDWRADVSLRSHASAVRSSWLALLFSIVRGLNIDWLTDWPQLQRSENKLTQYEVAIANGLPVPRTIVTSSVEHLPLEFGELVVVKPLGPGHFIDETGHGKAVFASVLSRGSDEIGLLGNCPFIVQQWLAADTHLRVATVGEQAWVCELPAEGLPLDWRQDVAAHSNFSPTRFEIVEEMAVGLARALDVRFSSQDWIVADGHPYFIDLNPAGQWLFLPQQVSKMITDAICEWMARV